MNAAHRLPHLAQRVFNQPVMLRPEKAEIIIAALADRLGVAHLFSAGHAMPLGQRAWSDDDDWTPRPPPKPFDVVQGVAVIPVQGTLVHRLGSVRPVSGMTGYDGIRNALLLAASDSAVRAVMLDIDSPGGEVSGVFDLTDTIYAARRIKPIWAVLDETAYSAAYAIASAASHITVPRTGATGSIGAVWLHTDFSKALDENGVKVTIVRSAPRKFEGNAYEPLSEAALARAQAGIDRTAELFVNTVARNRNLSAPAVRDQQAACFEGELGVRAGLADAVMAPDEAFRALIKTIS